MMIGVIKRLTAILLVVSATELAADTEVVWSAGPYLYDGAGNIKSIGTSETFVYDRLGRLISGTAGSGHLQEYTYDAFGNILSITTDSNTTSPLKPCVDAATNQIDRAGTDCNASGTYDSVGNMTAYGTNATFVYDDLDMVEESNVNLARKAYLYNANDECIATIAIVGGQRSGSEWTIRDNDGRTLRRFQKTATGTWSWTEDYIYRDNALLAAEVPGPERTLHFHLDHLGTPRLITGSGGAEISLHTYYPFGQEATSSAQDTERAKFTGHERDDANLDYMHARYYLPYTGRFLSVDPVMDLKKTLPNPQMWNRYAYVLNSPINAVDPDGRQAWFVAHSIAQSDQAAYERGEITRDEQLQRSRTRLIVGAATVAALLGGPSAYRAALNLMIRYEMATAAAGAGSAEALRRAANAGGPTVRVVTNQTQALQQGRELYAAAGDGAQAAANAARSGAGVTTYAAEIPQALMKGLQSAGLVEQSTLVQKGSNVVVTQYKFLPGATEYILKFFKEVAK